MKKLFSLIPFWLLSLSVYSQQLSQVSFGGGSSLSSLGFMTDQNVLIRISEEGKVMEWGIELQSERNANYYAPNLQPFMGRIDYYGPEADSVVRGKVKTIGTCLLTYYDQYETDNKIGKLKSVGTFSLDYYTNYDNVTQKGKLRNIGSLALDYYSSFENEGSKGKLKTIGSSAITYYSSFDDKMIRGKIKSIGPVSYQWYTSLDRIGYGGGLKTGSFRQNISGITYIIQ
ncbi:MAG: hypothetical protein SGI83_17090 [Bacteroidota bacterium]|nr:hypothetical protein [Bacteroidota bacterium]